MVFAGQGCLADQHIHPVFVDHVEGFQGTAIGDVVYEGLHQGAGIAHLDPRLLFLDWRGMVSPVFALGQGMFCRLLARI